MAYRIYVGRKVDGEYFRLGRVKMQSGTLGGHEDVSSVEASLALAPERN
jgi:hypothetical protein